MKEIVQRSESKETLADTGVRGAAGVAGGVALMLLRGITGFGSLSIVGLVAGGALSLFGVATAGAGKERADKVGGLLTAGAGAATIAASLPVIGAPVSSLMWVGGLGLIGYGAVQVVHFLRGLRARR